MNHTPIKRNHVEHSFKLAAIIWNINVNFKYKNLNGIWSLFALNMYF